MLGFILLLKGLPSLLLLPENKENSFILLLFKFPNKELLFFVLVSLLLPNKYWGWLELLLLLTPNRLWVGAAL